MKFIYKSCLLKLSGESLKNNDDLFSSKSIKPLVNQLKTLVDHKIQIGIIIGGGNIWRGRNQTLNIDRVLSDNIGMTATVINALVFFNELNNHGIPAIVLSAYKVGTLTEAYSSIKAKQYLAEGKVVIFAGGTGLPFFTTDTAVMLRAVEIDFDIIAIAKNDTDGIYDKDPNLHHDAVKLHKINHHDLLSKELKVFDLTATAMCKEHQLSVIVFNLNEPDSILKVMGGEIKGTIIS